MYKSFRLHLIVCFTLCLGIYIFANRISSEFLVQNYLETKVQEELYKQINVEETSKSESSLVMSSFFGPLIPESLKKCSEKIIVQTNFCNQIKDPSIKWKPFQNRGAESIDYTTYAFNDTSWYVLRKRNGSNFSYAAMDSSETSRISNQTWEIRNFVVLRIFPFMFILVVFIAFIISNHIVKIINSISSIVSKTDIVNLSSASSEKTRFKEFQPFLDVFFDLKTRLKTSFEQASRFSSDASHELKTPLAILRGYAEMGIKTTKDGSNEQIQFSLMAEEINRLINITEKLLILARADAGRLVITPSKVNLSDLLELLVMDAETINADLRISSNIQKKVIFECDQQLIHQLIYNFYSNAIKYNIPNGWIHFKLSQDEHYLLFEIINPSQNVPADLAARGFERFFRGEESHSRAIEGNGLGLSLCKEIAKIHGGSIDLIVNSTQHVSTKFLVPVDKTV